MDGQRRALLGAAAAGAFGLFNEGLRAATEPPLETTRVRFHKFPSVCQAPMYVAQELLRSEGFNDVSALELPGGSVGAAVAVGEGKADVVVHFAAPLTIALDRGAEITVLSGIHPGCFELFTSPAVRSVKDLKGKTVCVPGHESVQHIFLASIAASVGLDPAKDVNWIHEPAPKGKALLAEGKIDGYLGFPPDPQELRDKKIGRLLLSSTVDRPWSQYFCCMVAANRAWVAKHPVAAKRVVRTLLKASELCAADPELGVKAFLAAGYKSNSEYARQALKELPYRRWRDDNPEESLRFYALRLREAGMVKGTPQRIISQGSDWRILEELKREMKA